MAITLLGLGVIALLSGRKALLNKLFLAFTVCVGIWIVAACVSNDVNNPPVVSLYGNYVVFFFSYFASYSLLWLAIYMVESERLERFFKRFSLPFILVGIVSATPPVVAGVEVQDNVYAVNFGPLVPAYGIALMGLLAGTLITLGTALKKVKGARHDQINTVFWSLAIAVPILLVTQFIAPAVTGSFEITDIGILAMALPVIGLYYSTIKHRLFDVRLAAVRSLAYILAIGALGAIYYLIAYLISISLFRGEVNSSVSVSPINIFLALVLAFIFQPIKKFFDRITNEIFYRDAYNSDEFYADLSELLASTTDLRGLLERASLEIATTLKAEQAFFFLYFTNGTNHHMSAGTPHHSRLPLQDARAMDMYMKDYDEVILTDALPETAKIRRILISHKIALLMPLKRENTVIGYVCLGDQRSGHYVKRDIKIMSTIADELIIAIQNALSVHEVKEINATLQQRIDVATKELRESNAQLHRLDVVKDEFVSMASHQLRTPLTSVKGYISMLLDGDAGKLTETQQKLLSEAFKSSERMVGLIGDFLSVSRVQTGRFVIEMHPNDLGQLVQQEVESLHEMARTHSLTLRYVQPKKPVKVNIDEEKIRQIIMNFIDNAVYYTHPGGTIKVNLAVEGNEALLTVTDNGIGVPAAEQAKLFAKFFRATNARKQRPDGTGVGLYLAKKVISGHKGKLIFESQEGKGSTFGFSLPIDQA